MVWHTHETECNHVIIDSVQGIYSNYFISDLELRKVSPAAVVILSPGMWKHKIKNRTRLKTRVSREGVLKSQDTFLKTGTIPGKQGQARHT